ncbi:GFA family protein [Aquamicrobium sp. LC103]|uniref:GFA family protein n=1 Tax=Aquamicrobium sp. LC103 TaxID=1120658 RepID=UPI00063E7938|nr:GFA family protein [Aquamicrobium sp. LC103]TKT82701.1 GFA family protein [Aquamicrobium sp. LC103]
MTLKGSCHCGATRFEIDFMPKSATRCTCTFCTKRGALWIYCEPGQFRLETPIGNARRYSPTTPENKHYFCPECGCTTFSDNPDYSMFKEGGDESAFDPARRHISVNLWALDDLEATSIPVEVVDGRNLW